MYLPTRLPETETREQSPFTLDALIAWLRTKDGRDTYCWADSGRCLYARYGKSLGFGDDAYRAVQEGLRDVHGGLEMAIALPGPHTFGAALSRATAIRGV